MIFSPNSKRVAFLAEKAGRPVVVLDGRPGPDNCGVVCGPVFRHDGVLEYLASDENNILYRVTSAEAMATAARSVEPVAQRADDPRAEAALASGLLKEGRRQEALEALAKLVNSSDVGADVLLKAALAYAEANDSAGLEKALEKLVQVCPTAPEAWYDLAALRAMLGRKTEALTALREAVQLGAKRRDQDPKARDLAADARKDPRFRLIRETPEWKEIVPGN